MLKFLSRSPAQPFFDILFVSPAATTSSQFPVHKNARGLREDGRCSPFAGFGEMKGRASLHPARQELAGIKAVSLSFAAAWEAEIAFAAF